MLQVIISPAKQMQVRTDAFAPQGIPPFPGKTKRLLDALRNLERAQGAAGLKALWRVNDKLLAENIERLHAFEPVLDEGDLDDPAVARLVSPAAFSYLGIQYRSMAPDVLDLDALDWLQNHLWILSGFYGCARPFDAVAPYRLEMSARLAIDCARDLYGFWGGDIAEKIEKAGQEMGESEGDAGAGTAGERVGNGDESDDGVSGNVANNRTPCIVNLASVEYAKAVLPHLGSDTRIVTCIFGEELRNGKPVQRATASKIARGSMVRWMAERRVEDVCELECFDVGYACAPELSTTDAAARERTLVFMKR